MTGRYRARMRRVPIVLAALMLLLFTPAAQAATRPAECEPLTGDELSWCLWEDLAGEPSPTPTPTPTPSASPSSLPQGSAWLSGASGSGVASGQFGTWRSAPAEVTSVWLDETPIYPFAPGGEYANWTGPADVGISIRGSFKGWAAEASGVNDAWWTTTARNLAKYRGDRVTFVRPWYEFNGDWFAWSVKSGDRANFVAAWNRVERIFQREYPQAKMMLGAAAAGGGTRVSVADVWPDNVDGLSIDFYNEWPWCNTTSCFDSKIENGGGVNSLEDLRRLAQAKGVPVVLSEWGSAGQPRAASAGGGGDAPVFMSSMHAWISKNAGTGPGQVWAEVYFNVAGYEARFEVYPSTVQPNAAAEYQRLFRSS